MSFSIKSTHQYVNPQPELPQPKPSYINRDLLKDKKTRKIGNDKPTTTRPTTNSTNAATGFATRLTPTSEDFY